MVISWRWVEESVLRKELGLVEDRRTSHVRPLTEIRDEIERQLKTEEQSRLSKLYIDLLRKKTFVLYF
jgi:hypothetical protein